MEDKKFLSDPGLWPSWPAVPIKKRREHGLPDCGILVDGQGYKVYDVNIWNLPESPISKWPVIAKFGSLDDLLADGWVVD